MTMSQITSSSDNIDLSLDSPEFQRDPYPTYAALRKKGAVQWSPQMRCFLVTRHQEAKIVLRSRDFTVDSPFRASRTMLGRTLMDVDGDEHSRLRALTNRAFVPSALPKYAQELVIPVVEQTIDRFQRAGKVEIVSELAELVPLRVLAHIIGIPLDGFEFFRACSVPIIAYLDSTVSDGVQASSEKAVRELKGYLRELIDRERKSRSLSPETVISQLVAAQVTPGAVTDDEIINQVCLLIPAAIDTTTRLIANTLHCLFTYPEQLARAIASPELIESAVVETLRFEPPIHSTIRIALHDFDLAGTRIPRGAMLYILMASANRDELVFSDPDRFDVSRDASSHLSFGFGRHQCMGRQLAVVEVTEVLKILLRRCRNLRFAPGERTPITGISFRSPERLAACFDVD
jgi:pulcherriminic acid synthase